MEKLNIVITGRRNTGKSSLINTILGQEKAIVSEVAGTTTDPIKKSYEVPGYAALIFTDTAGTDDEGELGSQRINKTFEAVRQSDAALLVITDNHFGKYEQELAELFKTYNLPFLIIHNKSDIHPLQQNIRQELEERFHSPVIDFSTRISTGNLIIEALRKHICKPAPVSFIGDIVKAGDIVMLVTPIDSEAPTGRMILPQVQLIRDTLDNRCINIVLQPDGITSFLQKTTIKPSLVITDSQVFKKVAELIPAQIPLTSFSIVLARQKGNFENYIRGTRKIEELCDKDRILMLESCSHHVSCEDIGRVKIPAMLRKYTNKELEFDFIAGLDAIKRPLNDYAMVIQCGGCMVTPKQLRNRLQPIVSEGIPVSNYGMTIAYLQGIFERTLAPFYNKTPTLLREE